MIDFSTLESETVDQCLAISVAADATGDYEVANRYETKALYIFVRQVRNKTDPANDAVLAAKICEHLSMPTRGSRWFA